MILWLNGAYGAGKSTTAELIQRLRPHTLLFDAEAVGNAVRDNLEQVVYHTEFPEYELWREFVAKLLLELGKDPETLVIVPMTVLNGTYLREIFAQLEEHGLPWRHMILDLAPETIRERVLARGETPAHWCYQQADRCAALLPGLPGTHLDASGPAEQVASEILARLRARD